jgi:hypothetical protein
VAVRSYLSCWLFCFCALWIALIPIKLDCAKPLTDLLHRPFYAFTLWISGAAKFESDSRGMYDLLLTAVFFASPLALLIQRQVSLERIKLLTRQLLSWYLALILIKYGWIKIIGLQFYLPEPNTVYSAFGSLSKDIAYWSLIGASDTYSAVTGVAEITAGILLLFRRTRFAGALLSAGIFANVVLVNFAFDISVKLFSVTLLLFSAIVLFSYRDLLKAVFLQRSYEKPEEQTPVFRGRRILKLASLAFIVCEALYPTISAGILNDDKSRRKIRHGAYQVLNDPSIRRLYVHRKDYLILENKDGAQLDYRIRWTGSEAFFLTDERTEKKYAGSWLRNGIFIEGLTPDTVVLRHLPYSKLPLFDERIHLFSDDFH